MAKISVGKGSACIYKRTLALQHACQSLGCSSSPFMAHLLQGCVLAPLLPCCRKMSSCFLDVPPCGLVQCLLLPCLLECMQSSCCVRMCVPRCWRLCAPYRFTGPTQPHCLKLFPASVQELCHSCGHDSVLFLLLICCRTVQNATLQPLPRISN